MFLLTSFSVWFQDDELDMELPYDVNFDSLVYFMVAPTLCYQVRGNFLMLWQHHPLCPF